MHTLSHHFLLDYNLGGDFTDRFKKDLEPLQRKKALIKEELKNATGIRMWVIQYLLKVVEGCIRGLKESVARYLRTCDFLDNGCKSLLEEDNYGFTRSD